MNNRIIKFSIIAFAVFMLLIIFNNIILSSDSPTVEKEINTSNIDVYVLESPGERKRPVDRRMLSVKSFKPSELEGKVYSPKDDIQISSGTIFANDVVAGDLLHKDDLISPKHQDYVFFTLLEDEVPYWYELSDPVDTSVIKSGDYVSFLFTQKKSDSNFSEASSVSATAEIILESVKVIKISDVKKSKDGLNSLVLALNIDEVAKIEKAKLEGELKVILTSNLEPIDRNLVELYVLNQGVEKGQKVNLSLFSKELFNRTEAKRLKYTVINELKELDNAVFRDSFVKGTVISNTNIANVDDDDYGLFFLKENEFPYWINISEQMQSNPLIVNNGELVSLVYSRVTGDEELSTKVILDKVNVLNLIKVDYSEQTVWKLMLALSVDEILTLENAKLTGMVSVVLSTNVDVKKIHNRTLHSEHMIKSRQSKVIQLRGEDDK